MIARVYIKRFNPTIRGEPNQTEHDQQPKTDSVKRKLIWLNFLKKV